MTSCRHCGTQVSTDFRRVYGDNHDQAHRCPNCDTFLRLSRGSGSGRDVDFPDPQESPGRQGNVPGRWT
jgi:hypothetical protein